MWLLWQIIPKTEYYIWIWQFWENTDTELYYSISLMMVQYFIPLGVLLFTYSRITFVVWGIQHDSKGHGEINLNRSSKADKRSQKVGKSTFWNVFIPNSWVLSFHEWMNNLTFLTASFPFQAVILTLAVVIGFTLAWLPYNVNYIIRRHNPSLTNEYISIACHWLAMSHSFYNPMIYAYQSNTFRNAFTDVYRQILCCVKSQASIGMSARCRDQSSFSTRMSTVRWKSYRKISITPEPINLHLQSVKIKEKKDLGVIKEEIWYAMQVAMMRFMFCLFALLKLRLYNIL